MSVHHWSIKLFAVSWALAAAFCFNTKALAVFIVNDTWLDGTDSDPAATVYSENGNDDDSDGNLESAWFQGGDGTLDPTAAGGPLHAAFTDPINGNSSATWTTYFTPEGDEVNLSQPGDSLKVTWVFTPTGVNTSNTSQNFRLALVDSPSAARIVANGSPGSSTYTGYGIFANMGQTLGNSNPFQLREHDNSGALLSGSGDWLALANGATSGNTGYASGTEYTFMATITRTALSQLQVDVTMTGGSLDGDGSASVSFLDATPNGGSFKFDTLAIRPSGATTTAASFNTRLFRVEAPRIVPEPATLGLLSLGGMTLLGMVKRRRS